MTNRPKILVVEDSEDVLRAISLVLKDGGFEPVEARDGRVALKVLFEARPDCVVLDVNLPELDGWKVLARIRDMSDVPVLMLTARHDEADKVRGLERGADDYMTKPFSNPELIARVNALLRRSRTPAMRTRNTRSARECQNGNAWGGQIDTALDFIPAIILGVFAWINVPWQADHHKYVGMPHHVSPPRLV